jgi:hypothetical protein
MRSDTTLMVVSIGFIAACSVDSTGPTSAHPSQITRVSESVTFRFPDEDPGPPFYTLIEPNFLPHTDQWAPIVFVRDPTCVASNFNLLLQLAVPQAFGCRATVEGHVTYKNGPPPIDPTPWQVVMRDAGGVPIWFAPWPALQGAIADGVLTLPELAAIPGLRIGTATMFQMTQQLGVMRPQGPGNGKIELVARGSLQDGTSFSVELREMGIDQVSTLRHIDIVFR